MVWIQRSLYVSRNQFPAHMKRIIRSTSLTVASSFSPKAAAKCCRVLCSDLQWGVGSCIPGRKSVPPMHMWKCVPHAHGIFDSKPIFSFYTHTHIWTHCQKKAWCHLFCIVGPPNPCVWHPQVSFGASTHTGGPTLTSRTHPGASYSHILEMVERLIQFSPGREWVGPGCSH